VIGFYEFIHCNAVVHNLRFIVTVRVFELNKKKIFLM
jgi:hypothetical protein